jgi:glyoxylate reductase
MATVLVSRRFKDSIDFPKRQIHYGKISSRTVGDVDAIVSLLTDRIDEKIFAAAPRLKIVANVAVGVDNIDLCAARARKIHVTNTPDVLTDSTADLTWALILGVARRVVEADAFLRVGRYKKFDFDLLRGMELSGKTLGIIGPGRIGKAVAKRARGFGMKVLFAKRDRKERDRLLKESDIVSLHCPLSSETHHLIGVGELKRMKRSAILINTTRGPVVDEGALAKALRAGEIAGAGLDVFEKEPFVHRGLLGRKDVVLLPHIGSATHEARGKMVEIAFRNVREALAGRVPPNSLTV